MRRAVVPLMRTGYAFINELIPHRLPCLAAVVGSLDLLAEPAARLRRVQSIGVSRRAFHVVQLPPGKMGPVDVPSLASSVRCQNERALARADEYTYTAHSSASIPL